MSNKPIFVATHPRACSTAFERVFMTRRETMTCVHEPFGDAFYFGPERLGDRYQNDEAARIESGFAESTYKTIFDRFDKESQEGKRLLIKDICHYLVPPEGREATIAPSLGGKPATNGVGSDSNSSADYPFNTVGEPGNPTVVPAEVLKRFHFTFLIRHPRYSIPSYYRCTIPPLDKITGFYNFSPAEAGYDELRRVFDFLRADRQIGPAEAGKYEGELPAGDVSITVIDADDLLDDPSGILQRYCKEIGVEFVPEMLIWNAEDTEHAQKAFEKWVGFHNDAIDSSELKPRAHKKQAKTTEQEDAEWLEKYGAEGQKLIRDTVNANTADYEYLKSFAIRSEPNAEMAAEVEAKL